MGKQADDQVAPFFSVFDEIGLKNQENPLILRD
jgi:hypothetical protein